MRMNIGIACLILGAAACGPSSGGGAGQGGTDAAANSGSCTGTETRCRAAEYQVCSDGEFVTQEVCATACSPDLGCVECRPDGGTTCVDSSVHQCNSDGTIGDMVEMCVGASCVAGECVDNGCLAQAELVYVVSMENELLSFDPRKIGAAEGPFNLIGTLDCPTQHSPYGGSGQATPFSMSVDRSANAWVLYGSGELFHVSTTDASCQATAFTRGQLGMELFGMGFVSNAAGSDQETLYIAGGSAASRAPGDLGYIDASTLQVTKVGALPKITQYGPELTGTGNAELFGYYPDLTKSYIGKIRKDSGMHDMANEFPIGPLAGSARAWAFAHWGGTYYIFITTVRAGGGLRPQVLSFNRQTQEITPLELPQNYVIVGAGVSTCAPVVID